MGKKKKKGKSLVERFNEKETKGNVKNTFVKGGVDAVASSVLGTGLGAVSGKYSTITGIALIFAGDESGVLRVIGSSAIGYGIAKAKDYKGNPEYNSVQKRVKGLGNDLFTSLHFKWKQDQKPKSTLKSAKPIIKDESDLDKITNGIDLAEKIVKEQKAADQMKQQESEKIEKKEIDPFDDPETDLTLI